MQGTTVAMEAQGTLGGGKMRIDLLANPFPIFISAERWPKGVSATFRNSLRNLAIWFPAFQKKFKINYQY